MVDLFKTIFRVGKVQTVVGSSHGSRADFKEMIFKRAEVTYNNSVVNDYKSNTEKMKLALEDKNEHKEFDEELFEYIVKEIKICKDGEIDVIFINEYTFTGVAEETREDDKYGNP